MGVGARALRAGKAVIEVGLLVKPVERQLRALQARVQAVGQKFARIGTFGVSGGGFAGLRNLFIGSMATEALLYPVKLASNIELASAQMSTFTGDAGVAHDMLVELQKFSAVAFVPPEQLSAAAAMLLRYGDAQENVLDDTKALSVIAAGNTDEFEKLSLAYAQVASAGRLQGEEMRQFKNTAFNPIREIAERTGESMLEVKKRMEAGEISFAEVQSVLRATVTEGGRFEGMLTRIAKTAQGQFNMAIAKAKLSLLTLGETALPPITKALNALNGILPGIAALIERNKKLYTTILGVATGIAALAMAFVTLGLGAWVLSLAIGGVASIFALIGSAIGMMLSPLGMVVSFLIGLATWFLASTNAGRTMVANLVTWFRQLSRVVSEIFTGIANALSAGSVVSAANVLWAGIRLAWLQGTQSLRKIWIGFVNEFKLWWINLVIDGIKAWSTFTLAVERLYIDMKRRIIRAAIDMWEYISTIGADEQKKKTIGRAASLLRSQANLSAGDAEWEAEQEVKKRLAMLSVLRQMMRMGATEKTRKEIEQAEKDLADAKKKFDEAKDEAEVLYAIAMLKSGGNANIAKLAPVAAAGIGAAQSQARASEAFFDTRLVQQAWGRDGETFREQLRVQRQIERNTRRKGGGLPVI